MGTLSRFIVGSIFLIVALAFGYQFRATAQLGPALEACVASGIAVAILGSTLRDLI